MRATLFRTHWRNCQPSSAQTIHQQRPTENAQITEGEHDQKRCKWLST